MHVHTLIRIYTYTRYAITCSFCFPFHIVVLRPHRKDCTRGVKAPVVQTLGQQSKRVAKRPFLQTVLLTHVCLNQNNGYVCDSQGFLVSPNTEIEFDVPYYAGRIKNKSSYVLPCHWFVFPFASFKFALATVTEVFNTVIASCVNFCRLSSWPPCPCIVHNLWIVPCNSSKSATASIRRLTSSHFFWHFSFAVQPQGRQPFSLNILLPSIQG